MSQGRPSNRERNAFGQKLFELREAAGLTQAHVAKTLGVTQQTYSDLERTPVTLHIDRIKALAVILGTTVSEMIDETPPKRNASARGKLHQVFETASKLPRRQQKKILDVVEPFVREQAASSS